jgi:hypothetical protein
MIRAEEMHPVAQKSGRSISLVTSRFFNLWRMAQLGGI